MISEQIKGFGEAYKQVKKLKFESYLCLPNTTWKEAHDKFKSGLIIHGGISKMRLKENVRVVLGLREKKLPYCKKCKQLFSEQEFIAGFKNCEHCERIKK